MDNITLKGAHTMPTRPTETAWKKANTVTFSLRLQKSTDADLLELLSKGPKQTIIKAALREYIKNHPEA